MLGSAVSVLWSSFVYEVGLQTELRLILLVYELFCSGLFLLSFYCFSESLICILWFFLSTFIFLTTLTVITNSIIVSLSKKHNHIQQTAISLSPLSSACWQ